MRPTTENALFPSGNRVLNRKFLFLLLGILFLSALIYVSINVTTIKVAQAAVDCSTPVTNFVRNKNVTFSHCYGREFTHSGTEYDLRVYYVESPDQNSVTNVNQCAGGVVKPAGFVASECEHAIAVNDDGSGNNATVVAVADEMETAMRFYLDQDLDFIPDTSLDVYIAEDNRGGGISLSNSYIYIDDDLMDNNDSLEKRILAFHEMQHLVQGEYDSSVSWAIYGEGVARAIEDRVDPGLDADTGHLFIPDVNKVLGSSAKRAGDIVSASYDSNMWWTWLMDQYRSAVEVAPVLGWGWLRNFYEKLETMPTDEIGALSDTIASQGSSFRDDFIDYSLALWAYKYNPANPRLDFLDAEIKGPATAGLSGHVVVTGGPAFPQVNTPAMNPRSVRHYEYNPANQCEFVSFVFSGSGKEYGFSVLTENGGSLKDRWTVYATDFARTVRGVDLDRIVGVVTAFDQSGNVNISHGCVDPSIDIKSPSTSSFIMVGNADNPRSFVVRLSVEGEGGSSVAGLVASDFSVNLVDGLTGLSIPASILNSAYVLDDYWLLIKAPTDSDGASNGSFYDVDVILGSPASPHDTDSESLSVLYVERKQDVEIVLDNSGSMGQDSGKLEAAQNAATLLTELLDDKDQVGYIHFNSTASVVQSLDESGSGAGSHRQDVLQAILQESAGGSTAIGDGMSKAATDHDSNQAVGPPPNMCSFILLSDGQETAAPYWEDSSSDVLDNGCSIHTVALGPEANEMLMQAIAGASAGGSYDYATSSGNVPINSTLQWDNNLSRVYDSVAQRVAGRERITTQVQSSSLPGKGITVDFSELESKTVFKDGEKFVTQGLQVTVDRYALPSSRGRDNRGLAIVSDTSEAGGAPVEMLLAGATLDFSLQDIPSDELSLRFSDDGGGISLSINGLQANKTGLGSLNGETIAGVSISVKSTDQNTGTLLLKGHIKQFSIGGEKLYLDNVAIGDVGDTHVIPVDDSSDELVVVIAWQDDTFGSHETILSDPNGSLVPNAFKQTGHFGSNEIWRVPAPKQGKYRLVIKNLEQEYFITGSVISDYRMFVITGNSIEDMKQGARVPIVASLTGPNGVLSGATVHARVIDPNGDIADVILHDNGRHGDGAENDGIYANWYTATSYSDLMLSPGETKDGGEPAVSGSYVVRVYATWKDVKREGESSFAIGPALDSGNGLPDRWEEANGLDPNDTAAERKDPDFDGLSNVCEFRIGTNPLNSDTDGGGESDGSELSDPAECVLGDINPSDPSDDRASPLSFVHLLPQASVQSGPFFEVMIGKPQNGLEETFVDVIRQAVDVGTGIAGEWATKASALSLDAAPVFVDDDVELGYRYQYIVRPWFIDAVTSSRVELRTEFTPSVESSADPYEPGGTVLISGGQLATSSSLVDLDISLFDDGLGHVYSDEIDVADRVGSPQSKLLMRLSNSTDFGNDVWMPYQSTISGWDLGQLKSGERKTVYVQVKDEAGNVNTRLISDDIAVGKDGYTPDVSPSPTPLPTTAPPATIEVGAPAVSPTPSSATAPLATIEVGAPAVSPTPTVKSIEPSEGVLSGFACTAGDGGKSSGEGIAIGVGLIFIFGYLKRRKWRGRTHMENNL